MMEKDGKVTPLLRLVTDSTPRQERTELDASAKDVDWSILMARAQTGDGVAYGRLFSEITPYLRSLAAPKCRTPHDIEDAVQDVLVTVHSIRATYDPSRPFAPWLVTIANRRIIDHVRKQVRTRGRERAIGPEDETFVDDRANSEGKADYAIIQAAVEALPPGQQQAIKLLKLNELSLKEAAAASGLSIAALKVATHRALKSLRDALTKGNEP